MAAHEYRVVKNIPRSSLRPYDPNQDDDEHFSLVVRDHRTGKLVRIDMVGDINALPDGQISFDFDTGNLLVEESPLPSPGELTNMGHFPRVSSGERIAPPIARNSPVFRPNIPPSRVDSPASKSLLSTTRNTLSQMEEGFRSLEITSHAPQTAQGSPPILSAQGEVKLNISVNDAAELIDGASSVIDAFKGSSDGSEDGSGDDSDANDSDDNDDEDGEDNSNVLSPVGIANRVVSFFDSEPEQKLTGRQEIVRVKIELERQIRKNQRLANIYILVNQAFLFIISLFGGAITLFSVASIIFEDNSVIFDFLTAVLMTVTLLARIVYEIRGIGKMGVIYKQLEKNMRTLRMKIDTDEEHLFDDEDFRVYAMGIWNEIYDAQLTAFSESYGSAEGMGADVSVVSSGGGDFRLNASANIHSQNNDETEALVSTAEKGLNIAGRLAEVAANTGSDSESEERE